MTERSVTHATFASERRYDAAPARVFAAWAQPAEKARWFATSEDGNPVEFRLDFRVGGQEINRGGGPDGVVYTYEARYHDIVADQRIVYAYDMYRGETRISASLATVELKPDGAGTRLVYTEQGAFLDGLDKPADRESGMRSLMDALGASLKRAATA